MARPLRREFAGALHHVTARGDGREDIFLAEQDRLAWFATLAQVCARLNWTCHAYCQITNHYHVVVETPDANLAEGMRQLNGVYTQRFNCLHCLRPRRKGLAERVESTASAGVSRIGYIRQKNACRSRQETDAHRNCSHGT